MQHEVLSGRCMCGVVRFELAPPIRGVIVCHCRQCARWSGHVVAATAVAADRLTIRAGGARSSGSPPHRRPNGAFAACVVRAYSGSRRTQRALPYSREHSNRQPALLSLRTSTLATNRTIMRSGMAPPSSPWARTARFSFRNSHPDRDGHRIVPRTHAPVPLRDRPKPTTRQKYQ